MRCMESGHLKSLDPAEIDDYDIKPRRTRSGFLRRASRLEGLDDIKLRGGLE